MKLLKKLRLTSWALAMLLLSASGCQGGDSDPVDKNKDKIMPSYQVGDYFDHDGVKGIVAYFDEFNTEKYGWYLIVSLDETELAWSTEFVGTDSTHQGMGDWEDNDKAIKSIPGWETKYPAFKWCDDHNTGSAKGWHLPQIGELASLHNGYNNYFVDHKMPVNKEAQANFNKCITDHGGTPISNAVYWSSSQQSYHGDIPYQMAARVCDLGNSYDSYAECIFDVRLKDQVHKVRAVNYFHYNYYPDFD